MIISKCNPDIEVSMTDASNKNTLQVQHKIGNIFIVDFYVYNIYNHRHDLGGFTKIFLSKNICQQYNDKSNIL